MTRKESLAELIVRLEAGETPNQDDFRKALGWHNDARPHLAVIACDPSDIRAIGAAKALHEAVLPEWEYAIYSPSKSYGWFEAQLETPEMRASIFEEPVSCAAKDPARAWFLALLRALLAEAQNEHL